MILLHCVAKKKLNSSLTKKPLLFSEVKWWTLLHRPCWVFVVWLFTRDSGIKKDWGTEFLVFKRFALCNSDTPLANRPSHVCWSFCLRSVFWQVTFDHWWSMREGFEVGDWVKDEANVRVGSWSPSLVSVLGWGWGLSFGSVQEWNRVNGD